MTLSGLYNANVLVTGGAGFIGANLVRELVRRGARVMAVDAMVGGHGAVPLHVEELGEDIHFLREPLEGMSTSLLGMIRRADVVFHLAGQSHHWASMEEPLMDLRYNCSGTLALLDACRRHNPSVRIVFTSTRQVYGTPTSLPVYENHPLRPVDVNGIHKMAAEQYIMLYHRVFGLPVAIARLTNTYGPRMRICDANQTFLGYWIRQAIEGNPFEVWGGEQLRDFNYVDDVVGALLQLSTHPVAVGKVYNLGGSEVLSLAQTAEWLTGLTGTPHKTVEFPKDRKSIDIGDYFASHALISKELGWMPSTDMNTGLSRTLDYFRRHAPHYLPTIVS